MGVKAVRSPSRHRRAAPGRRRPAGPHKEPAQRKVSSRLRGWRARLVAVLGAFGVLSAIGAYYIPGLLDKGAEATGRVPVLVDVAFPGEYTSDSFFSPMYLFPEGTVRPEDVPKALLEGFGSYWTWAREHGAVDGQDQSMRLTIRGREASPVIIQGIKARVVGRSEALRGWFTHERGCGDVAVREANINLDKSPPTLRFQGLDADNPEAERLAFTVQVSATDVEVVDVVAHTFKGDVKWVLEVLYESKGKDGVLVIDDHGRPFHTSALVSGRARYYRPDPFSQTMVREASGDPQGYGLSFC